MVDILSLLASEAPSENDYLAQSPLYSSGINLLKAQIPQGRNNLESLLLPLAQGLSGGLMMGYGQKTALDDAFKDYKLNPLTASMYVNQETRPEGWTPKTAKIDLFSALLEKENEQAKALQTLKNEGDIQKALLSNGFQLTSDGVAPIKGMAEAKAEARALEEGAIAKAKLNAEMSQNPFPKIPKTLQDEAIKETQAIANKENSIGFINSQFEKAKELPSMKAFIGGTTASNEMEGISQGLKTFIQKYLGREMNGPEQERFLTLLPDWNDTKAQIDSKKARFFDLLNSITPTTPILKAYEGVDVSSVKAPISKPDPSSFSNFAEYKAAKQAWLASGGK